jgi:histidinol-phosphate/aromatic aminotransferase/cobyric acid decarboxylase-like protein
VVDESYIDFLPDAAAVTMIGCGAGNVMVLRSPSKFYGLAGLRSGAAWTLHLLHARWRDRRTSWPVSAFAARALATALAQTSWAATVRGTLARDTAWLEGRLARTGLAVTPGRLHFRLLTGPARQVTGLTEALDAGGVAVRVLPPAYGAGSPAVRISAPHHQHRPVLDAALGALGQPPQDPPARPVPTPPPTGPR